MDYAELVKALRDDNACLSVKTLHEAADAIEELCRKEKFHAFIWNTLGNDRMRLLIDAYREQEETE